MNEQQLIQAYIHEKDVRVKERLFLIKQVLLDKKIASHVAKSLGQVRSWAYKWIERFNELGINGLQDLAQNRQTSKDTIQKTNHNRATNSRKSFWLECKTSDEFNL